MAVTFENDGLVIKIPNKHGGSYEDLYNLQTNLIRLLRSQDDEVVEDNMNCLDLLQATLIEPGLFPPQN